MLAGSLIDLWRLEGLWQLLVCTCTCSASGGVPARKLSGGPSEMPGPGIPR